MFGTIATDESTVFQGFVNRCTVVSADVVEIGGCLPANLVRSAGIASWLAVDPANCTIGTSRDPYRAVAAPGSRIPLDDECVDFAFSSNALEHIQDLDETLTELARVLKPGGVVYAHFGPIWSAPDGHHLETVVDDVAYNFWEPHAVPHWAHLALDENAMARLLAEQLPAQTARSLAHWIYHDPYLNRRTFEEYIEAFVSSPLNLVHLETTAAVDYLGIDRPRVDDFHAGAVRRLGGHRDLFTRDMLTILRKP
jgi:SAM-dependent methyltransferase